MTEKNLKELLRTATDIGLIIAVMANGTANIACNQIAVKEGCMDGKGGWQMKAYGETEHPGKYVLDDYVFSRNHTKTVTIRRWKRILKKKARQSGRKISKRYLDASCSDY